MPAIVSSSEKAGPTTSRWNMATDVAYDQIQIDQVRDRDDVFGLVASASLVESGTDTYASNLRLHYRDNPELGQWLAQRWEPEELQHGRALRAYVERVWPEFDWPAAFESFFQEYGQTCTVDQLEPSLALEMVARCVVETGTSTYYRALQCAVPEPVLADLAGKISHDEVLHFKQFYHHFQRHAMVEGVSRAKILGALWRRLTELRHSDSEIALRHVYRHRYAGQHNAPSLADLRQQMARLLGDHLPIDMTLKMLIKPLRLPPKMQRWIECPVLRVARTVLAMETR